MRDNIYSTSWREEVLQMDQAQLNELNAKGLAYLWQVMLTGFADLHIHSNFSEGKDSPPQIFQEVLKRNMNSLAITDTDNIMAIEIISILYDKLTLLEMKLPDYIPALELPAEFAGQKISILAYFPYGTFYRLEDFLAERKKQHEDCIYRTVEKIHEYDYPGLDIKAEEVLEMGGGTISRLHLASLLQQKGFVDSLDEAFNKYLGEGKEFYVKEELPEVSYVLELVRKAGGVPVLAGPAKYPNWIKGDNVMPRENLLAKLESLQVMGLQGMEVMYSEATFAESRELALIGSKLNLLPTSGSNYHGSHKPHVHLYNSSEDLRKFLSLFYSEFRDSENVGASANDTKSDDSESSNSGSGDSVSGDSDSAKHNNQK